MGHSPGTFGRPTMSRAPSLRAESPRNGACFAAPRLGPGEWPISYPGRAARGRRAGCWSAQLAREGRTRREAGPIGTSPRPAPLAPLSRRGVGETVRNTHRCVPARLRARERDSSSRGRASPARQEGGWGARGAPNRESRRPGLGAIRNSAGTPAGPEPPRAWPAFVLPRSRTPSNRKENIRRRKEHAEVDEEPH